MFPIRLIPIYIFELAFWIYVGWSWVRWARFGDDPAIPRWRRILVLLGFLSATFCTVLDIFFTVHAIFTGGYSFYHPVELFCIRAGSLASLLGLLIAFLGKGKLRLPTLLSSSVTLFLWFADAMAQ